MGIFVNVIGYDGIPEDDFHFEEPPEYKACVDCAHGYNSNDCKQVRSDLELNVVFG